MSIPRQVVSDSVEFTLAVAGGPSIPVQADLGYDPSDPYAVRVSFHTRGDEIVEWTFARSLLTDGVTHDSGEGDVSVRPLNDTDGAMVQLALSSPAGRAEFEAPLPPLVQFLARTYSLVPTGTESDHVDLDGELAELLGG